MKGKRALAILGIFLSLFTMLYVSAEEITYQNVITDDTTIEEDFEILGMEIEDYYIPKSYDYDKWYVIAMSEAYIDKEIQTYFYLYNPAGLVVIPPLRINYSISEGQTLQTDLTILEYDAEHGYLKANGFKYSYRESCTIGISSILSEYEEDDPINSGEVIKTYREDSSDFKASLTHSLLNESFGIELNFNSTLVIEDYHVVRVSITQDDNFINNWNTFWGGKEISLDLYFYNFNFPERIKYDSVEYAKFQYDYLTYYEEVYQFSGFGNNKKELRSEELVVSEYTNDSKTLRVNDRSQEMTFPTFYLGNRFDDGQFDLKNKILLSGEEEYFDCDCSVLLDSTYRDTIRISGQVMGVGCEVGQKLNYTVLDQIELLELHYKNDGILYKCQVVVPPVDDDDILDIIIGNDKSWIEKLLIKIADFILNLFQMNPNLVPNWGKYIIGGAVFIVALVILIISIPGLGKVIIKGLGILGTGIWFVVSLPFRLIGKLFKRE